MPYLTPTELWIRARPGSCPPSDFPAAGDIGALVKTGTGSGALAVDGHPIDAYAVRVQISLAGELASATVPPPPQPRCKVSLDGGVKFGRELVIPKGGVVPVPDTGLVLTFATAGAAPSFALGDRWDLTTTASPEFLAAIAAAGDEADWFFRDTFKLPLQPPYPPGFLDLVARLARYRLLLNRGPKEAEPWLTDKQDALKRLDQIAQGLIQPEPTEGGPKSHFPDVIKTRRPFGTSWRF